MNKELQKIEIVMWMFNNLSLEQLKRLKKIAKSMSNKEEE